MTLFRNLLLQASVMAARRLHAAMTHLLRALVAWFEDAARSCPEPLDISQIDQVVATQFKDCADLAEHAGDRAVCTAGSGELASQLVVLCAVALAVGGSFGVFRVYRPAARELKRLESLTKSPLFATFGELVSGAHVIRAFGDERRVISGFDTRVDDANRALYNLWVTNQWLRVSMNGGLARDGVRRDDRAVAGCQPRRRRRRPHALVLDAVHPGGDVALPHLHPA